MLGINSIGRAWVRENRISSDGQVTDVDLTNLQEGATELWGKLVKVDGKTKLNGIFRYDPFQPGKIVTQDGFDQVVLYYSLNNLQEYLAGLGIDSQKIISSQHAGTPHPIVAHANASADLNAWYSPQSDDLTFGTNGDMSKGQDKWHLVSDSDVTTHEGGHLLLDHTNRRLGGWLTDRRNCVEKCGPLPGKDDSWTYGEGRAIHEGFGDALAALIYDDPEMSEDFAPNLGRPPSKTDGLRNANNDLTLNNVGNEEHDRGQVYAGFFWSIKKMLSDPNGPFKLDSRRAADLTLKILFNHASNYATARPKPVDFVDAVMKGIDALAASNQLGVDVGALKSGVLTEAARRKMVTGPADTSTLNEGIVRSFSELAGRFGSNTGFIPDQRSVFIGGSQDIYQQQQRLSSGRIVDAVGGGIYVTKNAAGQVISISIKDVRQIKPGEIDETIRINPNTVLSLASSEAQKQFAYAQSSMMNVMFASMFAGPEKSPTRLKELQMDLRIAEAAVNAFDTRFNMAPPTPKLVVIPGSNHLQYEVKVGLGIYYVDAQTGTASFKRDVLVN